MIEETNDDNTSENTVTRVVPIESRFMFVDVAALRAKQLRRGAVPRVTNEHHDAAHKLERVAMEEVRKGLIEYSAPDPKKPVAPEV
jgi:DNA-directed RNA polymerase omega subunit